MGTRSPSFHTSHIGPLRAVLDRIPALKASIGEIVRFRLVVDANFVVQELIHRLRAPTHGPSAFEELVKATIIEAFAPRWLDTEMMISAIPKAAKRSKVSEEALRTLWGQFRSLLKWDETLCGPGSADGACCDPKDQPYIQLERKLSADGILSKDGDIARMGGHALTLDFVLSTRKYARSIVTTVSIRVLGITLPAAVLIAAANLLGSLVRLFASLPDFMKALIVIGGATLLLNPTSRQWITDQCRRMGAALEPALRGLAQLVVELSAVSTTAEHEARLHLKDAIRVVRPRADRAVRTSSSRHRGSRARAIVLKAAVA